MFEHKDKFGRIINGCFGTVIYEPPLWKRWFFNRWKWEWKRIVRFVKQKLGFWGFKKISIPLIQRSFPVICPKDIVGVQPMQEK